MGEIQEATAPSDWYWIDGQKNIADWATRGKKPQDISENSLWQQGPEFLQLHKSEWPIKNTSPTVELPELTKKAFCGQTQALHKPSISNVIDITRVSCYYRLLRVTARILAISRGKKKSLRNIAMPVETQSWRDVECLWILDAQKSLQKAFEEGKFLRLCARRNDYGIIVVGGRALRAFECSYDAEELILLPYNHPISHLYAERVHKQGHAGVSTTMSKIRTRFWIPNLRKMVRSIKGRCVTCRKTERCLESHGISSKRASFASTGMGRYGSQLLWAIHNERRNQQAIARKGIRFGFQLSGKWGSVCRYFHRL